MKVGVPKEVAGGERRVAITPDAARALIELSLEVGVESGAGLAAGFADADYEAAGATVEASSSEVFSADLVLKVAAPCERQEGGHEVDRLSPGAALVAFLRPLDEPELAARLAERGVNSFAMELVPRITRAQSMDALSSMSTIAGYRAVILAAEALPKIFPMLVTAAGTIQPARGLIIGAGVAGLQA
ncbi:MAG: NAD(P)(+) transhydrogenase (Re/Si-specific) subunit alpha, partial [Myxococcota bacterium]